jgi:LuxR family maltose regulon positive regulatory protein
MALPRDNPVYGSRSRQELQDLRTRVYKAHEPAHDPLAAPGAAAEGAGPPHRHAGRTVGGALHPHAAPLQRAKPALRPPLPAAACVLRPALLARIDAASRRKLLLLAAPIGSGKTTLLTQWYRHAGAERSVAWLSLEEGDGEPARFFSHLVEAVRSAAPTFDACVTGRRHASEALALQALTGAVNQSLGRLQQDLVIVLDDFQWLAAPALLHMVDLLLQRSPPNVHWILSGRCVPELNMSPLRLRDQLATLDAADLNFDSASIEQLGRQLCGRPLTPPEAECIQSRTEGWVAGVKLALLAVSEGVSRSGVTDDTLHKFAGSHNEVARYLGASVLQAQSPQVRSFLVASSVVDRMSGELCNALLDITHGQALLEQLERSQLFIQPLDSHGRWYRYHTLFLDFLRSCLRRDAARIAPLHERASRWFAEHQLFEEALEHAFAGADAAWRRDLVARCARTWWHGGEHADVIRWCEKLPRAEVIGHEDLCEAYISSLILSRHFDAAVVALREAQAGADAGNTLEEPPGRPKVPGPPRGAGWAQPGPGGAISPARLRLLHMMLAILSDSGSADGVALGDADSLRSEGADGFLSGNLLTLQAYAMLRSNRFDVAWRLAMRARDTFERISAYGFGYASVVASLAERAQGDVKSAARRCEHVFALVRGGRRNPAWVTAATALAYVRYEENRLAEAETLCMEVLPLLSMASTVEDVVTAHITLVRIKALSDRGSEALQLLDYLHSVLESGCHRRFLAQVCGEKIRLCLLQGKLQRAQAVAAEFGMPQLAQSGHWQVGQAGAAPRPYDEAWERLGLAQAWLLMHGQAHAEAAALLALLRDSAHAVGYVYRELPLEATLAQCHWEAGDHEAAFRAVNRGLALTRGHGFWRSVFDEAPALTGIVAAAIKQRKLDHALPERYLRKFENVLGPGAGQGAAVPPGRRAVLPLEPLTDREIDVLRLLARGLSNQEISAQSQIALSTAKWHLKNVFAKLDVNTRTGAIARARQLQLID